MIDTELGDSRTPWQPAGLRLPQVGDRVRLRLGGECRVGWPPSDHLGHPIEADGLVGTVFEPTFIRNGASTPPVASHPYAVIFRRSVFSEGWDAWVGGLWLAAIELEILADDDGG